MLLGLHTYSFHLHGMGQDWGGFEHNWPRAMDIFQLMDFAVNQGLEGLHITAADCERTDEDSLRKIRRGAEERGLYLEYNFSMDEAYDTRLTNTLEEGIAIARALGADIAKVSMDLKRPQPVAASPGSSPRILIIPRQDQIHPEYPDLKRQTEHHRCLLDDRSGSGLFLSVRCQELRLFQAPL